MKKYDVVALGELLIDFAPYGLSDTGKSLFEVNPGGAPSNVLSMLRNLGYQTAFMGKVGKDMFGRLLKETLEELDIDTSALRMDESNPTTLAFIHTLPDGDRDFSFYRKFCADVLFSKEDISKEHLENTKVFHFGSLSLTQEPVRGATIEALEIAKKNNAIISYDPNYRPLLWDSEEEAKKWMSFGLGYAQILKISLDELQFLTGKVDIEEAVDVLKEMSEAKLICVTDGKNGSTCYYKDLIMGQPSISFGGTIETTGAGDTFCASLIHGVLKYSLEMSKEELEDVLLFASAASYLVTTKKGALLSMPSEEEVLSVLKKVKNLV